MNWKLVVGLILVTGLLAVGAIGVHTHVQVTGANNAPSINEGPHPPDTGAWSIAGSDYGVNEGPHPPDTGAW